MDWPASDASVYAMIPFRKLRRSVSVENSDYNADTTPIRIGVSRMRDEITPICAVVFVYWGLFRPASPRQTKPGDRPVFIPYHVRV